MHRDLYIRKFNELREKAERAMAKGHQPVVASETADIKGLMHEVSVQQVELEMQHDELLKTHHHLGELRQQAERAREQYQHLFDRSPIGMVVVDVRGVIVKCNMVFADLTGRKLEELPGRTLAEHVAAQDRMNFDVLFKQEIRHQAGNRIDIHLADKAGNMTPLRLLVTPLEEAGMPKWEYLVTLLERQA